MWLKTREFNAQTSDTEKGMIFCVNHYEYLFVKKVLVEYYTIYYIKIDSVLLMLTKAMKSSLFMVSHDVYRVHECLLPQIYIYPQTIITGAPVYFTHDKKIYPLPNDTQGSH